MKIIPFCLLAILSCSGNTQQVKTPKEYINRVKIDSFMYISDSISILRNLYLKMKNHEESFSNPEYFDSTELIVDTIIYDLSINKIGVFVIAKNPTFRNPYSDSKLPYYFNASCYLGKRRFSDSSLFELKRLGPFKLVNFEDKQIIKQAIRSYYFFELATLVDERGELTYKYNLNDKRFWESSTGWKRMFNLD